MSEIKRGSSEIITFLYGIDSRGTVKNTTFRKKSKSKRQFSGGRSSLIIRDKAEYPTFVLEFCPLHVGEIIFELSLAISEIAILDLYFFREKIENVTFWGPMVPSPFK